MTILFLAFALAAQASDLEIDNPYYRNSFEKITCSDTQEPAIPAPSYFSAHDIRMDKMVVSITLDRALLLMNFSHQGVDCRYNAVFSVDKSKFHRYLTLVESKAFSQEGEQDACQA